MADYSALIEQAAKDNNVDPALIRAVIQTESGWNPNAENKETNAKGLGQFIPSTASGLKLKNPNDPNESIPAVAKLLSQNLDIYKNPQDAVRAYHGGTNKANWGPKTEAHVAKVFSILNQPHGDDADQILASFLTPTGKNTVVANPVVTAPQSQGNTAEDDIINLFLPKTTENVPVNTQNAIQNPPVAESNDLVGTPADLLNSLTQHLMNLPHGGANLIEKGIASGVNAIAPNSSIAKYIQNIANQDVLAAKQSEKQYQATTPTNILSLTGATLGEIAPALFSGGGSLIESGGTAGANLASKLGLGQTGKIVGDLLGKTVGGAGVGAAYGLAQPVLGEGGYGSQKAEQLRMGALTGGIAPSVAPVVSKATEAVGKLIANTLGMTAGVGGEAVKQGYLAGVNKIPEFWKNLTGQADKTEVLDTALANLKTMQSKLSQAYKTGMIDIKNDKSILDFKGVDKAIDEAKKFTEFNGKVVNEGAANKLKEVQDAVTDWKKEDSATFHTPEGFDKLKQKIAGILETIPYNEKQSISAVKKVYNSLKDEINAQAPTYGSVMKNYSEGSEIIADIQKALSLNPNASVDTQLRKLQSLMRNNVNTNYGHRLDLAQQLESEGGRAIMPALAGQSMSSLTPRGLAGGAGILNLLGIAKGALVQDPMALIEATTLPFQSPRAVGTAAYGLGRLAGSVPNTTKEQNNLLNMLMLNTAIKQ
jgi:hypothetical protein